MAGLKPFLLYPWFLIAVLSACEVHKEGANAVISFKTSDSVLQKLFDSAEQKAKRNISLFGKYKVLVEGGGYNNVWLETQPMGGYMYAKRDLTIAENNIRIFMDLQREDGRIPGMISYRNDTLIPHYGWFQGYCFPMPAYELYFLMGKNLNYLKQLYNVLEKFDHYLWKVRDSDKDGCLETWGVFDTGEDNCTRLGDAPNAWPFEYPPTEERISSMSLADLKTYSQKTNYDFVHNAFPVPIESMDIMSYSYTGRDVLSLISKELKNGQEGYWRNKANEVKKKIKDYLWNQKEHACYDRDKSNLPMPILLHNNLRCMYYGSFDQEMADEFIKYHMLNPKEFWTPYPLPSIAANDPYFRNVTENNWSGQPEGLTYQRSIGAMENYGHYAELTMLGKRFLGVTGRYLNFTQQVDPFTSVPSSVSHDDAYGPSILTALEFISRMYGIHVTQDNIYWSCLDSLHDYEYAQKWENQTFSLKAKKGQVSCFINDKRVFAFSAGIRVVTNLNGEITQVVGIDTTQKTAMTNDNEHNYPITVRPNEVYKFSNKTGFFMKGGAPFFGRESNKADSQASQNKVFANTNN